MCSQTNGPLAEGALHTKHKTDFMYRKVPFGPQMALAYRLDAISQGPKNSQFPGPNPLPLALVKDAARIKSITHGAI